MADDPTEAAATEPTQLVCDLLADAAAGTGDGTLPTLTREELFTLSDAPALEHAGDVAWWRGLDDIGRELVRQTAERGLVARKLLTPTPDGGSLVVDPRVHVVARARAEPSWLAVLGEPANSDVQVVAHGIDLAPAVTTAVLLSARVEGVYLNRLLAPEDALEALAQWLLRDPVDDEPTGRTIELITPHRDGDGEHERHMRAIVFGTAQAWVLSEVAAQDQAPGDPVPTDAESLRAWLTSRAPRDHAPR